MTFGDANGVKLPVTWTADARVISWESPVKKSTLHFSPALGRARDNPGLLGSI